MAVRADHSRLQVEIASLTVGFGGRINPGMLGAFAADMLNNGVGMVEVQRCVAVAPFVRATSNYGDTVDITEGEDTVIGLMQLARNHPPTVIGHLIRKLRESPPL